MRAPAHRLIDMEAGVRHFAQWGSIRHTICGVYTVEPRWLVSFDKETPVTCVACVAKVTDEAR